ncbi:MAG TPA: DUF2156 domain-containing protein [Pirellulales bacterium]|nr:DUF2156 domain-containing protein [Pirellulales bacterium]
MLPVCQEVDGSNSYAAPPLVRTSTARGPRSLEAIAFRHGQYYDSYLATDREREVFWSRERRGLVALVRVGRYLQAGGGLIAPRDHRETLLAELVAQADGRGEWLSFYNVAEDDLPLFRRHGFQATKLGEEAVLDLGDWSCQGKPFQWLRRQVNHCRRQRLAVRECVREQMTAAEWAGVTVELAELSAAFLAGKPQSAELRFLDGSFDPARLGRRRIFVARSQDRCEGFLVCNPYRNGAGWAFEIYRQRHDAVRGTVPFLMHEAIEALRQENVRRVSLCLVPGLRAAAPIPGDSTLVRRSLSLAGRYFNFVFDTAGLYHYKSRFRPRFEERYLCARPRVSLRSAWALVRLLGVLEIEPSKLARVVGRRWRHRRRRATLALPE